MAPSKPEGLMINRLLVLLQLFLIPIYFFFFSIRWRDNLSLFFDNMLKSAIMQKLIPEWLVWFEIHLGIPIFFSLPWVVFTIMRATRIADSYELMGRALGRVRIDQKLFYGLNAAFTLIFLIFPFFSPIITIIGIIWSVRLIMRKLVIGRILKIFWILPALILSFVPGLIAYAFYSNYVILFNDIFAIWTGAIPTLFGIGLSLAIAIALGNFFLFLLEGRQLYGTGEDVPYGAVLVLKAVVFIILVTVFLASDTGEGVPLVINLINYFAAFLGFFELIVRRVRKMPSEGNVGSGIIMVLAFSVINIVISFLKKYTNLTRWIQTIVIVVSGLLFFVLFYLSYTYAPQEFNYPSDDPEPAKASPEASTEE